MISAPSGLLDRYQDFIANYHQLLAEDDVEDDPTPRASLKRRLSTAVMTPVLQRRDRRNSFMFSATSPDVSVGFFVYVEYSRSAAQPAQIQHS